MADEYIQQLRRMMSEIEDRRDTLSDNEYLTEMNNCLRSYLTYHEEHCTCTEDTFECYQYPRLLRNCRHKDTIIQYAPLLAILIPGGQIPADFRLQMEVQYEPYDHDLLVRTLRYLLDFSIESEYNFDRVICAFSIFHLVFKHYGILEKSQKLREVIFRKLEEFQTSEGALAILENFDFSVLGISENPIPIWGGNYVPPPSRYWILTNPKNTEIKIFKNNEGSLRCLEFFQFSENNFPQISAFFQYSMVFENQMENRNCANNSVKNYVRFY